MHLSLNAARMLRASLVVLSLVVALPIVMRFANGQEVLGPRGAVWIVAFAAFFAALLFNTARDRTRAVTIAAIVIQSAAIPLLVALVDHGYSFAASLLAAVTGQVVTILGRRTAVWWSVAQTIPVVVVFLMMWEPVSAVIFIVIYSSLQLFALLMTSVAVEEAALRSELGVINAELRATRQLVADSSRSAERLRIARELHDVAGHHLTALTLNLESARHRLPDDARDDVDTAIRISRQLLAEIRTEVTALREVGGVRFDRALETLSAGVAKPKVLLEMPEDVVVSDGESAMHLLRCVQEIITNAARHGSAETLRIAVNQTGNELEIIAHDDGRGVTTVVEGNGLRGMRERVELLGGRIEYESAIGRGFTTRIRVPLG